MYVIATICCDIAATGNDLALKPMMLRARIKLIRYPMKGLMLPLLSFVEGPCRLEKVPQTEIICSTSTALA